MKWSLFIDKQIKVSVLSLMNYYTISYFVNLFTPSTVGGDVSRSLSLGKKIKNQANAFSATFFERLTGLIAMLLIVFCSYFSSTLVRDLLGRAGFYFIFFLIISLTLLLSSKVREVFINILGFTKLAILDKFSNISKNYHLSCLVLLKAFFWALVFHSLAILNVYLSFLAISSSSVSISNLAFVVPLILLILSVPMTPGGLGVQEGAYYAALTKIGASPDEALIVAGLLRFKSLFIALIGGLLIMFNKKT